MTRQERQAIFSHLETLYQALEGTMPDGAFDAALCNHIETFCQDNRIVLHDSYSLLIDFYSETF